MGTQERLTKLPLATFGRIMGVNPLHLQGVQIDEVQRLSCGLAWPQSSWQNVDATSREELAEAIGQAEAEIEQFLGYRLTPSWESDERQPTVRPNRPELLNTNSLDVRGFHQVVRARWGWFITGGVRVNTLLGAAEPIVYSNTKPATADYEDTATVTATVVVGTDPCEVHVYYPGHDGDDRFEIRPLSVVVAGTTATITFARELVVAEADLDTFDWEAVEGEDDTKFLTTVDVYRVFNDPQTQASVLWEPIGNCNCDTTGSSCPVCEYQTQTACLLYRDDPRMSILAFQIATWDATTEQFDPATLLVGRNPDQLRLFYYAGLQSTLGCPALEMDRAWAVVVARLAAARLDRPPCTCSRFWWERWAQDLSFTTGAEELSSYSMSPTDLDNPFGTRRGEVYAWNQINRPGVRAGGRNVVFAS